ncbi:hypothetical protein RFI_16679 [Reticulomyxa filosa]|uniref:Uncharacterized protein n=1 Tax=Reticulomyxa filosa TaxID=46433 RepID=X6N5F1_RETFI|nr:hypothetical protein RFI_16679 [Reticulomyxa filosa]|eukprot:ETO20537.1 hypothetical protein RFI_16679 [Reticulomyxa filosa]
MVVVDYIAAVILLIYLFVKRLFILATTQAASIFGSNDPNNKLSIDLQLSASQQKLVNLMTKYCMLSLMALVSSCISGAFNLVRVVLRGRDHNNDFYIGWFSIFIVNVDVCVNVFCLCLQFKFSNHWYEWCCQHVKLENSMKIYLSTKLASKRASRTPPAFSPGVVKVKSTSASPFGSSADE